MEWGIKKPDRGILQSEDSRFNEPLQGEFFSFVELRFRKITVLRRVNSIRNKYWDFLNHLLNRSSIVSYKHPCTE